MNVEFYITAYFRVCVILFLFDQRIIKSHRHNPCHVLCRRLMSARRNVRRTYLLLATLVLFIVCWLPLNILNLGEDLNMPLRSWR